MNYTNLNITDTDHQFRYIIERQTNDHPQTDHPKYYFMNNNICFTHDESDLVNNNNYWTSLDEIDVFEDQYIPHPYKSSKMTIYFPTFALETYENNVKYALTINTWILGKKIILKTILLDRQYALAISSGPKIFLNNKYYEYIETDMIDPYELLYGDSWKDWRINVCGDNRIVVNDGGSNISINLCPVVYSNGVWIKMSGYEESQSAMLITDNVDDYLSCHIKSNINKSVVTPEIKCEIRFNSNYPQTSEGMEQYIFETYGIQSSDVSSKFILIVQDKENAYKYIEHKYPGIVNTDKFLKQELDYQSWSEYKEGLRISVLFQLVHTEDEEDIEWISMMSNYVIFDQELFKYFIGENYINNVKLNFVNMNNFDISVVNKVVNNIVSVERPDDYKSNIIKPVFYKYHDVSNITIHPAVTENICINLDAYKNKVNVFTIKISDCTFNEIGRVNNGVIFKIVGANLDLSNESDGTYYILNDEGELVTTGKYTTVL